VYGNNFHNLQGGEHVYYILPDRSKVIRVITVGGAGTNFVKPNGMIGTPDGKLLYVADIDGRMVYRYNIQEDGTLTDQHPFAPVQTDGITIDERGNIYMAGGNYVTIYSPEGREIERIRVSDRWVANATFGGADFKTLFITASSGLYAVEMNVKGGGR